MSERSVGPYRLDQLIGEGGMGQVWQARDSRLGDRVVALKILTPALASDPEFRVRFSREADRAAGLQSPHIIPVHSYGEVDGQLFIEMPLARGTDLDDLLAREGTLPAERAVRIVVQVARALDVAHRRGLVHRDVKPANVLVVEDADDFVYLVDFGIAKPMDGGASVTGTQQAIGSLKYMAPERFEGDSFDHRVDIYALGAVLFEMLTGRPPFVVGDLARAVHAHVGQPAPVPSRLRAGVPAGLDRVVATAMSKAPGARFGSAGELAEAARAALTSAPVDEYAGPVPSGPEHRARRHVPTGSGPTAPVAGSRVPPPAGPNPVLAPWSSAPPPDPSGATVADRRSAVRRPAWIVAALGLVLVLVAGAVLWWVSDDAGPDRPDPAPVAAIAPGQTVRLPMTPEPTDVAPSTDGRIVYVAIRNPSGAVAVVDATTDTRIAEIPMNAQVYDVAVAPDGRSAYVLTSDGVRVLSTATNTVVGSLALAGDPFVGAVSPDGTTLYATLSTADAVVEIDTATLGVVGRFPLGDMPQGIAVSPDGRTIYVTDAFANTVTAVDVEGGAVVGAPVPVGAYPRNAAVSPDGDTVWVSSEAGGTVSVLDADTAVVVDTLPGLRQPAEVTFSGDGSTVYVGTADGAQTYRTATRQRGPLLPTGAVNSVAEGPDGARVYGTDRVGHALVITGLAPS